MKTIGLIGGMSWESSRLYYEFLNKRANEILGGSHSAKCILYSLDFAEIKRLTFEGDWDSIGALMKKAAQQLESAGASIILLCTNTIHLVSHYITENVEVPFLHIATTTGESIQQHGLNKVALLGTKFTMEQDFYANTLKTDFDLDVIVPEAEDRRVVHNIIYEELVKGRLEISSKNKILEIINQLRQQGAQGIVLGCTELPLLIHNADVEIPLFDSGKIHAYAAVEWSLKENHAVHSVINAGYISQNTL